MFDDYKIVYCSKCKHSVFPFETAPWGTCCKEGKNKKTITKTVARSCDSFERKEKYRGKDKQRSDNEALQGN